MKKKTLLASLLTIAVCLTLIAGSTFALFTSEDAVNIAVTSGKVDVTATVGNLRGFSMDNELPVENNGTTVTFENGGTAVLDQQTTTDILTLTNITPGDKVTFDIDVENNSNVAILYRLLWTVDGALSGGLVATANGENIVNGKTAWAKWDGANLQKIQISVELPVEYETQNQSATISFKVEAVQGNSPVAPPENAPVVDSYEELAANIQNGGAVRITEDADLTDPASGKTFITLSGDTKLYLENDATVSFGEVIGVGGEGSLTIYGGSIDTDYELYVTGNATLIIEDGEHFFGSCSAVGDGTIILNGGTVHSYGSYGNIGFAFGENGSLIVNGGKLNLYQPINLNPNRCDNAYVEINGGTIELLDGIENLFIVRNVMDKDLTSGGTLRGSSIRINGGTFIAHYEVDYAGDATSFIRNGDSPSDGNKVLVSNEDRYNCIVTGGTFYGSWQRADNTRYENCDGEFVQNSIAGFVASDCEIIGDPDNGYVVTKK